MKSNLPMYSLQPDLESEDEVEPSKTSSTDQVAQPKTLTTGMVPYEKSELNTNRLARGESLDPPGDLLTKIENMTRNKHEPT